MTAALPCTLAQFFPPHAIGNEVANWAGANLDLPTPDASLPLRRSCSRAVDPFGQMIGAVLSEQTS